MCALLRLARRRQRRIDAAWVLTEGIRSVVVMIYVVSQYSVDPAIQFLSACGRERWARAGGLVGVGVTAHVAFGVLMTY